MHGDEPLGSELSQEMGTLWVTGPLITILPYSRKFYLNIVRDAGGADSQR